MKKTLVFLFLQIIFSKILLFSFEWGGQTYSQSELYSLISQLDIQQKKIENEIYTKFNNEFKSSKYNATSLQQKANAGIEGPIADGVADFKKYLLSDVKIMWVLKEPYDGIEKINDKVKLFYGGNWSMASDVIRIKPHELLEGASKNTWLPIAYICEGVKNKNTNIEEIMNTEEIILCENLQSIAYINLSKIPQDSSTDDKTLPWKFDFWKDILIKQINLYKPDIIIYGNTLKYIKDDLPGGYWDYITDVEKPYNSWEYLENRNNLNLGVYHPQYSARNHSVDKYCQTIIELILEYASRKQAYKLAS